MKKTSLFHAAASWYLSIVLGIVLTISPRSTNDSIPVCQGGLSAGFRSFLSVMTRAFAH